MNDYVNTNSPALKIFRFDNQKYKNRKPDRKPDPGPEKFFPQKLRNFIMSLMLHNFFQLTESIKRYEEKGALKVTTTIAHYRSRKNKFCEIKNYIK